MPEAETEEKAILQERQQSAAERRDRNALAIAEVVGRNRSKNRSLIFSVTDAIKRGHSPNQRQ